jgi:hypothetical protein
MLLRPLLNVLCRRDAATGEIRIGIFTTRPVMGNEELTYDYMFEHSGVGALAHGFKCMCGAATCRCGLQRVLAAVRQRVFWGLDTDSLWPASCWPGLTEPLCSLLS